MKFHIYTYRVFEILRKTWKNILISVGVCCCLQTCNTVVNMLVMGLVLGPSLMIISITGILSYAKVYPFINYYGSALLLFTRKLYCLQNF